MTREIVERYLDALNRHDVAAAVACVADDFHNEHTSALGTSVRGRAAYAGRLPTFLAQFRDLHYEIEDVIVDGARAAVAYRMTCRYSPGGVEGRRVEIRGMFRFRVENGLIAHRVDYWDGNEFARQISGEQ